MNTFFEAFKKKPLLIGGAIVAGLVVIYLVYKGRQGATPDSTTAPNQNNPYGAQSGQLGGYLMLEEDIIQPSQVNVTVGRLPTGTGTRVTRGVPGDQGTRGHREQPTPHRGFEGRRGHEGLDNFDVHHSGKYSWFDYKAKGKWWHAWYGANGRIWGNTGPNQQQTLLKGPSTDHVTHIASPVTLVTPPGHNVVPQGLRLKKP